MGWEGFKRSWVVSIQVTLLLHKNKAQKMMSFLLFCAQTWEEGAAGEVAGAGSLCRTCPQRYRVQARHSASRERLVECHPLWHWNLSFITSSSASYAAGLLPPCPPTHLYPACPPKASLHFPSKKDEQRPCPASFSSCSLFPLRWSLLLLYFSLAVLALSPSANPFCEQAVLGGHGGENPARDGKIHWLGYFYP